MKREFTTHVWMTRLTSTCNFDTKPFGPAPDFVMLMQSSPISEQRRRSHAQRPRRDECTKTQQHQPQRSGKKHVADTRGIAERTNWWETTPEAHQIFGTRDRTTQTTTPERTLNHVGTRATFVRSPPLAYTRQSRRPVTITNISTFAATHS